MIISSGVETVRIVEWVKNQFPRPLEEVHLLGYNEGVSDQDTWAHKEIYKALNEEFYRLYQGLTKGISLLFGLRRNDWVVQQTPTFRFQYPLLKGTSEWHRDLDYNHPVSSINIIVPCTKMAGTTAVFVEEVPYTSQYKACEASPGELIVFNGALSRHGSFANVTHHTRVSFDFRFALLKDLPVGKTTITSHRALQLGDYYREI